MEASLQPWTYKLQHNPTILSAKQQPTGCLYLVFLPLYFLRCAPDSGLHMKWYNGLSTRVFDIIIHFQALRHCVLPQDAIFGSTIEARGKRRRQLTATLGAVRIRASSLLLLLWWSGEKHASVISILGDMWQLTHMWRHTSAICSVTKSKPVIVAHQQWQAVWESRNNLKISNRFPCNRNSP